MLTSEEIYEKGRREYLLRADKICTTDLKKEYKKFITDCMKEYARQACEEQRKICAEEALVDCEYQSDAMRNHYYVNSNSIINAALPELK